MMSSISRSVQRMSDKMPAQGVANTVGNPTKNTLRNGPKVRKTSCSASGNGFQKKPLDPVKFSENPGFLEDL